MKVVLTVTAGPHMGTTYEFAEIIEDDPWMDTPLLDHDELLAAADAAEGDEW